MRTETSMEDFGHGQCDAWVGTARQMRCNQGAVSASGLCRFHEKVAAGLTDSSLSPAGSKARKVQGVYSYWKIAGTAS